MSREKTEIEIIDSGISEVNDYCKDVLDGTIPSGEYLKLAVKRFQNDLQRIETDDDFEYTFDPEEYYKFEDFCAEYLQHYSGKFAGNPVLFEPFQKFILGQLFGFIDEDGLRRFSTFSFSVSKKNGKSFLTACIALYFMLKGQRGVETLALATKKIHASKLAYNVAKKMIKYNDTLDYVFHISNSPSDPGITCNDRDTVFRPVPTNAEKLDGFLVGLILMDESKDIEDFSAFETLNSGRINVENSLLINTSTSGYNTQTIGYEFYQHDKKILSGEAVDDTTLSILYTVDDDDMENWDDLDVWRKANPLLGIGIPLKNVKERINKAKSNTRRKRELIVKNLNTWGKASQNWIDIAKWDALEESELRISDVKHLPAIMSFDLSKNLDLTNIKLTFFEGERVDTMDIYMFDWFYLPAARFNRNDDRYDEGYKDQFIKWRSKGDIIECGENAIDYDVIKKQILYLWETFNVKRIVFDPHNSGLLIHELEKAGISSELITQVNQGSTKSWNQPSRKFHGSILNGNIHHPGNEVMRFCVENGIIKKNKYDNIRPYKPNQASKIDGLMTGIMTMLALMWLGDSDGEKKKKLSPYLKQILRNNPDYDLSDYE